MNGERFVKQESPQEETPASRLSRGLSLNEAGDFDGAISTLRDLYDEMPDGWLRQALELDPLVRQSGTVDGWFYVAAAASWAISWFNLAVMTWSVEGREEIAVEILRSADELGSLDAPTILGEYLEWLKRPLEAEKVLLSEIDKDGAFSDRAAGLLGRIRFESRGLADKETSSLLTRASKTSSEFEVTRGLVAIRQGDIRLAEAISQSPYVSTLAGAEQLRRELSSLG